MPDMNEREEQLVWDLPVRIFHWALALVLAACWATQELGTAWMTLHLWLGYTAGVLVVFRLIWGFVGPRHARFASFLSTPRAVVAYLTAWLRGTPPEAVGHNPAGGWGVLLMLALVAGQFATGMANSDDAAYAGPWHYAVPPAVAGTANALHHDFFWALVVVVVIHVAAVLSYLWRPGIDPIGPMFTGRKRIAEGAIDGSRILRATVALVVAVAVVAGLVLLAPAPDPADLGIF